MRCCKQEGLAQGKAFCAGDKVGMGVPGLGKAGLFSSQKDGEAEEAVTRKRQATEKQLHKKLSGSLTTDTEPQDANRDC